MDEKKKQVLSDSELQKLRDELAESEKWKWLRRLIRTALAWTAGTITFAIAVTDAGIRLAEWVTRK